VYSGHGLVVFRNTYSIPIRLCWIGNEGALPVNSSCINMAVDEGVATVSGAGQRFGIFFGSTTGPADKMVVIDRVPDVIDLREAAPEGSWTPGRVASALVSPGWVANVKRERGALMLLLCALLAADDMLARMRPAVVHVRRVPAQEASTPTLTDHHVLKVAAVLAMIVDHVGRTWYPEDPRWTFPAQMQCAMFFYWLIGTNSAHWKLDYWVMAKFLALEYIVGPPARIEVYTLVTILVIRCLLGHWMTGGHATLLFHGGLVGALMLIDPVLGNEGLGLAYGARSFLYAGAGALKFAHDQAWRLWFAGAVMLHAHKTLLHVLHGAPENSIGLGYLFLVVMILQAGVLMRMPATAKSDSLSRYVPAGLHPMLAWISRKSLATYTAHLIVLKRLSGQA
jgi:hypothetical protein